MKALDTNILARYLTQDDPQQYKRVNRWLQAQAAQGPVVVNMLVLLELWWVLQSSYGYDRAALFTAFEALLVNECLDIEHRDAVYAAARLALQGHDFADALIGKINKKTGCTSTVTLDQKAARMPEFEMLD